MSGGPAGLFGKTFACQCGRTHEIEPREVVIADSALSRLPEVCARAAGLHPSPSGRGWPEGPLVLRSELLRRVAGEEALGEAPAAGRRIVVVMDARTRQVVGAEAVEVLACNQWLAREVVVPDPAPGKWPACDEQTRLWLDAELGEADLLVAVGSGVINDLVKWTAGDRGVPCVSFATAASMTGYASANVAPTLRGLKTLARARPPVAVLADPRVLRDAPYEMTAAGLGDVLARFTSSADWLLNHLLFGDYYCAAAAELVVLPGVRERAASLCPSPSGRGWPEGPGEGEGQAGPPLYLAPPERLRARDPAAVKELFEALLLVGVSQTMAGSSAPASGGEHLISHALDMMSALDGRAHDLHGRQVGVGTILAAAVYERLLGLESPRFAAPPQKVDRAFWGPVAEEVAAQYNQKHERMILAAARLSVGAAWDELRSRLAGLVPPASRIRDLLSRAGAAVRAEDIKCDRARLLAALQHAHELRARFTVLDLARLAGLWPAAAPEIVEQL